MYGNGSSPFELASHSKPKWWLNDQDPQQTKEHEVEERGKENTQRTTNGNDEFLDLLKSGKQWEPELDLYTDLTGFSIAGG